MRFSKYFIPTIKEMPTQTDFISQKLMLKSGMIKQVSSGLFVYLPTFMRVAEKVCGIIKREMEKADSVPAKFPLLIAREDLEATNRWQSFGKEMFTLFDRNKREYAISPTNEEYACFVAQNYIRSYKDLPFSIYQIQQKHRDEIRPRGGVMRAREFLMKDAYSFHADEDSLDEYYKKMEKAYRNIFTKCGLDFVVVNADSGAMGGSGSQEFMALAKDGEAEIGVCGCGFATNTELLSEHICPHCGKELEILRANEVGHIFKLGTRYTDALNLKYVDENNQEKLMIMGCYGIGIERVISSIIEQHNDERGIAFPSNMAPFKANIIVINTKDEAQVKLAEEIYETLQDAGVETLLDDRNERFGVKLADSELIGIPYNIIVGKRASEGVVEFQKRRGDKLEALAGEILQKIQ
ncbi:MAG: proline--tRNA ligase [Clostridia bacterium]|nr:proline--tRNA ligase [Clostridia bacterium]